MLTPGLHNSESSKGQIDQQIFDGLQKSFSWYSNLEKILDWQLITGSVYFTAKMLAATDRLELLCCQSNIQSHGMTQYKEKGHFVKNTVSCSWCKG